MGNRHIVAAVAGALLVAAAVEPAMARAPGFPPMPSTWAQWWGYGYGPGHHAPMLTTPKRQAPSKGPRYVRTDACSLAYPAPYAPIGCYGSGCEPTDLPASASWPVEAAAETEGANAYRWR